ncbi:hypothetical protein BP00DRAFT_256386 [Aspergillus indologenus CBS 114.80]|uniref:Uncharacterized protein n=1 Tax=Aspergillus indologenus CBS 114.80 TaxID=1450541 RepID=A0A2V5I313_9EURO|nr:hypothetical protein BP00DRAFT_256386 [Aspergillus indologenus CBS 114.80]
MYRSRKQNAKAHTLSNPKAPTPNGNNNHLSPRQTRRKSKPPVWTGVTAVRAGQARNSAHRGLRRRKPSAGRRGGSVAAWSLRQQQWFEWQGRFTGSPESATEPGLSSSSLSTDNSNIGDAWLARFSLANRRWKSIDDAEVGSTYSSLYTTLPYDGKVR